MDESELREFIRLKLGRRVTRRGWILYSGLDTLTQGDYYVMGYNPAVDCANDVLDRIRFEPRNWSAYTQQCWRCGPTCTVHITDGRLANGAQKPHQRRVTELLKLLEKRPEEIFCTNAIFAESSRANKLADAGELWELHWPIHQRFLEIIRPRWIICLGNGLLASSFSLLRSKMACSQVEFCSFEKQSYRDGKHYRAVAQLSDGPLELGVLGVAHPSLFELPKSLGHFVSTHLKT
jgi:hypothetical protein